MRHKKTDNLTNNNEEDEYEDNLEAIKVLLGYEPPICPRCGAQLKVRFSDNNFKCFSCGYSVDEEDLEDELDSYDSFSDVYLDGTNYPRCELCGTIMEYSAARRKFKCPNCSDTLDEADWELANEYNDYEEVYPNSPSDEEKPECCDICGGPYPHCIDGCKLINKD